jgi:hypothetical protein
MTTVASHLSSRQRTIRYGASAVGAIAILAGLLWLAIAVSEASGRIPPGVAGARGGATQPNVKT